MHRGGKFQGAVAMLALAGCNGESGKLTIRSTPAPVSSVAKPVPLRVAEARGHLAFGNVALALESYRKAVREQPDNVEALAGIAGCYDRMGRFDLSRRNYEAALALAPRDTTLLAAFAASLDLQGRSDEAAGVRREIRVAAAASLPSPMAQVPLKIAAPVAASKPASPVLATSAAAAPPVTIAAPETAAVAAAPLALAVAEAAAPILSVAPIASAARPEARPAAPAASPPVKAAPAPVASPSVTVALPPPKPATASTAVAAEAPILPASEPSAAAQQSPPAAAPDVAPPVDRDPAAAPEGPFRTPPVRSVAVEPGLPTGTAPRLERVSLGEVALVTSGRPQWRAQMVQRTDRSTTIRFVPLRTASAQANAVRTTGVRLLNAARYEGLAANTRSYLAVRGWRRIEIGDAPQVRQTSLILYPPSRRGTAKRLAAQFGFAIASRPEGTELVMLIGRDATRPRRNVQG